MQSKHPNRFFGLNPVAVPNNGRKETEWNHDLQKTWRDAVGGTPATNAAATEVIDEAEEQAGDSDDA